MPNSGRHFEPEYFAVHTSSVGQERQMTRAAFVYLGDCARFISNEPWPDNWHIEDAKGERVQYVAYRDNYTHASRLMETSQTHWGPLNEAGTREKMAERGWKLLDLTVDEVDEDG